MSKLEPIVAISSTESEYMALLQAVKESIWIQRLLKKLGCSVKNSDIILKDNQGAIALAHNPEYHAMLRMKNPTWSQRHYCYEPGVTALRETNLNPMNLQPQHARTKHIDVQYHFIRECVEMGKV